MKGRVQGRLGSSGMLRHRPALAAEARYTSTGLPAPDFIIPESAVNGIVIGAGLSLGLVGYNAREAPLGLFLLSVGGGLGALGTAFFIRSMLSKPAKKK